LDALKIAMEFEIDDYSALILVGGDGTFHEAINGLMRRKDGKKIPVGFLPNGSGDDLCGNLGIELGDIDMAMAYIQKGDTIKMDITKILIDHDSEADILRTLAIDPYYKIEDYLRYNITNCGFCMLANVARNGV